MKIETAIKKGIVIYDKIPQGWKIDNRATTAPPGYVWIYNGESYFGGKRKMGIMKEENK